MADPARGSRACGALAEQRSALVDGALDDADRERVLAHLVGCPSCRAEVAELRRIRQLLNDGVQRDTTPSYDLADRLVAIAGTEAQEPLLAAPFRQNGSRLRRRRRRAVKVLAGAGAIGASAVLVVAVGLSAAPPVAATISDPTAAAQAEFSALTAQLPLNDSIGSALISGSQLLGTSLAASTVTVTGPTVDPGAEQALDPAAALAVLRRAAASASQVSYRGTQTFQLLSDGRLLGARFTVVTTIGAGREVVVYDANGRQLSSSVTATTTSRVVDSDQLRLLSSNYRLSGSRGAQVAGRPATMVSASRPDGQVAARWWIDDASGLLLWHEAYDDSERAAISAGFTELSVQDSSAAAPFAERVSVPVASTSLTLGNAGQLVGQGWTCPDQLSELSLVRLRTDSASDPSLVHLAYTDGLSWVSVFEQRGTLGRAPEHTEWDDDLGAYVRDGPAKVASWQSGTTVFTVVTDGSGDLLAAAVGALPHDETPPRTTIERVRAGWSRILEPVTG
jgi:anti-sigma factor RsiW